MDKVNEQAYAYMRQRLNQLDEEGNRRRLPNIHHEGRYITAKGMRMLNLASNDYLGLAANEELRRGFLETVNVHNYVPSSSSSRLLTGNFEVHEQLEYTLAQLYNREAALVFDCGYHANTGIIPAITDRDTLLLADKLVHASIIDGMKLSQARCMRYRHNDILHLEKLINTYGSAYKRILIVTESLFSMDGDEVPLSQLVALKRRYPQVMLYVDEAHAFGVRGTNGLGCAEESGVIADVDFLIGTLGKAAASAGAFIVCDHVVREYLVNTIRPFIFTTALPPIVVQWSLYVVSRLPQMGDRRRRLAQISEEIHHIIYKQTGNDPSTSQIVPILVGDSTEAILRAEDMQRKGFYILPVRPPTVPKGTARLRLSLRADLTDEEVKQLVSYFQR